MMPHSQNGADLDGGHVCLAVLHPDLPAEVEAPPRDLKIVMDCSGSMQGDSIAQARVAVARIRITPKISLRSGQRGGQPNAHLLGPRAVQLSYRPIRCCWATQVNAHATHSTVLCRFAPVESIATRPPACHTSLRLAIATAKCIPFSDGDQSAGPTAAGHQPARRGRAAHAPRARNSA